MKIHNLQPKIVLRLLSSNAVRCNSHKSVNALFLLAQFILVVCIIYLHGILCKYFSEGSSILGNGVGCIMVI